MIAIPLNPVDLTEIYNTKLKVKDFVLNVDYSKSKDVLNSKQILTYLSNTGFRCDFDHIDEQLVVDFISLNFLVDSPVLSRIVANIIKYHFGEPIFDPVDTFTEENISLFVSNNQSLVNELVSTISSLPLFVMECMNHLEESVSFNHGIKPVYVDEEINIGPNILNIITAGFDAVLLVFEKLGMSNKINVNILNDNSAYKGVDLMKSLHDNGIVHNIVYLMPKSIMTQNNEVKKEGEESGLLHQ